jgi:hypothetical protein
MSLGYWEMMAESYMKGKMVLGLSLISFGGQLEDC